MSMNTKLVVLSIPGCIAYQIGNKPLDVYKYLFEDWCFANRGGNNRSEISFAKKKSRLYMTRKQEISRIKLGGRKVSRKAGRSLL